MSIRDDFSFELDLAMDELFGMESSGLISARQIGVAFPVSHFDSKNSLNYEMLETFRRWEEEEELNYLLMNDGQEDHFEAVQERLMRDRRSSKRLRN